jgi:NADH-quinone oxidoreductase subunit C
MSDAAITYATRPQDLQQTLTELLGERARSVALERDEVTVTVGADRYLEVMQTLA